MLKRIFTTMAALVAATVVAWAVTVNGQFTQTQNQVVKAAYFRMSTVGSLTALAGGAQAGTALNSGYNVVTTVASGNDSVQLPSCRAGGAEDVRGLGNTDGMLVLATNAAASNTMVVFPQTGEQINALGANNGYSMVAGKTAAFICSPAGGTWYSILGG